MQTFALGADALKHIRRRHLFFAAAGSLVFLGYIAWVLFFIIHASWFWIFAWVITLGVSIVFGLNASAKRMVENARSLKIQVDEESIRKSEKDKPDVQILRSDILLLDKSKTLACYDKNNLRHSFEIPSGLENNGNRELAAILQEWVPLTKLSKPLAFITGSRTMFLAVLCLSHYWRLPHG